MRRSRGRVAALCSGKCWRLVFRLYTHRGNRTETTTILQIYKLQYNYDVINVSTLNMYERLCSQAFSYPLSLFKPCPSERGNTSEKLQNACSSNMKRIQMDSLSRETWSSFPPKSSLLVSYWMRKSDRIEDDEPLITSQDPAYLSHCNFSVSKFKEPLLQEPLSLV